MIQPEQYPTAVWLLEINLQGLTFRWASEAVSVVDADGVSRRYDGGLDVDIELAYELLGDAPDLLQVPLDLYWPVSVADLVARGYDLSAATGELSLWADGTTYESRQVFLNGTLDAPEYGKDGEPIAVSLRQAAIDEQSQIMPPLAVVDVIKFADADGAAVGRIYPFVFGRPGHPDLIADSDNLGSPCLYIDTASEYGLIAGHPVISETVDVYNTTQEVTYAGIGVTHKFDGVNGTLYSRADLSGAVPAPVAGDELWVIWDTDGSIYDPFEPTSALGGGGSLLYLLLKQTNTQIDAQKFRSAAEYLNNYKVSGYIDSDAQIWPWLQENLLPLLPVSLANGPRGLYPIVWRGAATDADAVCTLTDGMTCHSEGPIKYESTPIVNECTVKYFLRPDTSEYLRRVTVGSSLDEADGTQSIAVASRSRYGRQQQIVETGIVYDSGTAYRIANDRIRLYGLRRRSVLVSVDWKYAFLQRGDVVRFVSGDYYLDTLAWVQSIRYNVTDLLVTLTILDDPQRTTRPFG